MGQAVQTEVQTRTHTQTVRIIIIAILVSHMSYMLNCCIMYKRHQNHNWDFFYNRNLQKKAKKKRYEEEKAYMERLRGAGCSVGEYVGDGQGESATVGASPGVDHFEEEEDDNDDVNNDGSGNCHPLLIFYDCEATGLSIYEDHITDIGAKVVACPIPLQQPSFSSLVKTSKNIPAPGK